MLTVGSGPFGCDSVFAEMYGIYCARVFLVRKQCLSYLVRVEVSVSTTAGRVRSV